MVNSADRLLNILGVIFTGVCIAAYLRVLVIQKSYLKEGTSRLQILSTRCVVCVPIYAIILMIILLVPETYNALVVPIALFEGYSFYCFFSLLVTNLGGPANAVKLFVESGKPLICNCFCTDDKRIFYDRILWALFHFVTTRVVIEILAAIFAFNRAAYIILNLVAFLFLVNAVFSTVKFFENIYKHCTNLMGVSKFLVIKVSVGLIVIQGIIIEIVTSLNKANLSSDGPYTGSERAIRIYCFAVLSEYLVISTIMLISFSAEILPSESTLDKPNLYTPLNWTWSKYLYELIQVQDVFGKLAVDEEIVPIKV